ncbi:arylsulfatase [candidate division KSB1 bacterium]|nr:arylsulfatase [candidate division KSB1 bacterium]
MNRREFLKSASITSSALLLSSLIPTSCSQRIDGRKHPNIVLIYTDDLGYGDVSCYGANRVQTPNIDRLAQEGIRFTQAYSTAATCTPSRYSLLTGQYAWRQKGTGVAPGDASLIIPLNVTTLPSMLGKAGYTSGVVGKWHLGLGEGKPDWNGEIKPGPLEIGFDYSFLIPATGDRVPCVYVENHHVVDLDPNDPIRVSFDEKIGNDPTGVSHQEVLKVKADRQHSDTIVNGISRIGYMSGGNSARWVDEDMADVITGKAVSFIEKNKDNPFFLYFALHDIHVPRVPHPRFVGKTELGPRGDAIVQADWCVGEVLKALERLNLAENTMVIFSSDNGPVLNDGYEDQAVEKVGMHQVAGPLRGGKYSSFEGGTRIPFLVRWPQKIKPGTSGALVSQVDLVSSFAKLVGQNVLPGEAPDSIDVLTALLGQKNEGRQHLVQEAGGYLSLRMKQWKYIPPGKGNKIIANKNIESGRDPEPQLYNLVDDIGEMNNVANENPEIIQNMEDLLQKIRQEGHRAVN